MKRYTDLSSGRQLMFLSDITAGVNIDVDGNVYDFSLVNQNYFDWNSSTIISAFEVLLQEATMVGRDLSVTTTRTGARKSIFSDVTTEVAANTADEYVANGLYVYGVMSDATNLVATSITSDWTNGPNYTVDQGDGVYRYTYSGFGNKPLFYIFASDNIDRVCNFQAKLISGDPSEISVCSLGFGNGGSTVGNTFDPDTLVQGQWTDIEVSAPSGTFTDRVLFSFNDPPLGVSEPVIIDFRDVRAIDGTIAHPAFPNDSAAGATYGKDKVVSTSAPSWGSSGTIFGFGKMYQGSLAGGVHNTTYARLFQAGGDVNGDPVAYIDNRGPGLAYLDCGGTTRAAYDLFADADLHCTSIDWDGVDNGIRYGDQARVTYTQSSIPTDEIDIGCNANTVGNELHGFAGALIFDRVISDAEYEILRTNIVSRVNGEDFR